MANEQNLRPIRTKSEARKIGRSGGIASGIARNKKKSMREAALAILSMPLNEGVAEEVVNIAQAKGANLSVQDAIIIKQALLAINGNTKAAAFVRDTAGENVKDAPPDNNTQLVDDGFIDAIEESAKKVWKK